MLFAVATPMHMMAPVSAGTLSVVPVISSIQAMPASAAGSAVMMMNGSSHDWKLITMSRYTSRIAPVRPTSRPVYDEVIVSIWPRATMRVPFGSLPSSVGDDLVDVLRDGAEVAALHGAEDVDDRLRVVVRDDARPEAARDRREPAENLRAARRRLIGMFCRSCSEAMRYCGVCATIGYCTPVSGFSQNVGEIWPLPESVSSRLFAMSRWLMPSCSARLRSVVTRSSGWLKVCWMRRSTRPGTWRSVLQQLVRHVAVLRARADDLHVDRRGQAEVQDLADDVGRQERERHAREFAAAGASRSSRT